MKVPGYHTHFSSKSLVIFNLFTIHILFSPYDKKALVVAVIKYMQPSKWDVVLWDQQKKAFILQASRVQVDEDQKGTVNSSTWTIAEEEGRRCIQSVCQRIRNKLYDFISSVCIVYMTSNRSFWNFRHWTELLFREC